VLVFLFQIGASLLDPISLVGYGVAGVAGGRKRNIWLALIAGAAWGIAMEILVAALNPGYGGRLVVQRVIGALLFSTIVYGVMRVLSRERPSP
jgi:hypothetical protein